ncbi:hypothetical protein DFP72DRAFT_815407 [Ephemerocybe angulata]|uniref:Reverse transcriptase domain-containing protein n=1 Tax=Ephemerocybe angulata TaxID=980116 RepID=A0A8H6HTF4_9AGAR|nr:hypothetical protein DFP72DRAFT_815407 [Tulosesus angulatus]
MADLVVGKDVNDIVLGNIPVTNLEQADDLIILSTSPTGLQRKLDALARWCATNFLILNVIKSVIMIFGTKPRGLPDFTHYEPHSRLYSTGTYVGIRFQGRYGAIFRKHYDDKASKAQRVGRVICGLESLVGYFQPRDAINLYMALVDPHLTHGCEITLDTNATALGLLEKVQIAFLRRLLGLGQRSILSVLYTETGILPIRYRRILLALGYLKYVVGCDDHQLVKVAIRECTQLTAANQPNWLMSLREVLGKLPFQMQIPLFHVLPSADEIDALISSKLYLLRGRVDPATGLPAACKFRDYLNIRNAQHRKAVTKVLTSNHWYAIESLRYARTPVPPEMRRCRLCRQKIETPEHAMFECDGIPELVTRRRSFVEKLMLHCTEATTRQISDIHDSARLLTTLISLPDSMNVTAEYLWDVNSLFDEHPIYVPT